MSLLLNAETEGILVTSEWNQTDHQLGHAPMKKMVFLFLCIFCVMATVSTADEARQSDVSLVVPNYNLMPNEKIRSGDTLFGLFNTNLGYVLLPSEVTVKSGVDERCRKVMTVTVQDENQPLFLIAGLPALKPGKVKTMFSGDKFVFPGEAFVLADDEREAGTPIPEEDCYVVRAYGSSVDRFKKSLIYDYALKLFQGDQSQMLDYYRTADDSGKPRPNRHGVFDVTDHLVTEDLRDSMELPVLIWAGDLDRDGKPDLFTWWPCPGKEAGVFSLFLSSAAKNGDLVAKVPVGVRLKPVANR